MVYRAAKRLFDIICSLIGIIISSPLWLIAVIGIFISDPGPVFYMARRIGRNNREFAMFKFRSMRQGQANESVFRGEKDRIFSFGRFIRASKIDELPQLLNILNGTMSVVGPRPAAPDQMSVVRAGRFGEASSVKAGLTGPSALYDYIYGDTVEDETEYEEKVLPTRLELDLVYIRRQSVLYDLKMILYTVICVLCSFVHRMPSKIYNELVMSAGEIS